MKMEDTRNKAHQDIWMLLPWYVNGTLGSDEQALVDRHVSTCLTCRGELVNLRKTSVVVRQTDELDAAPRAAFARLQRRIRHSTDQAPLDMARSSSISGIGARFRKWYLNGRTWHHAAFAVILVLILVAPVVVFEYGIVPDMQKKEYQTLGSPNSLLPGGHDIRVVFTDGIGHEQVGKILDSIEGQLVDGPSSRGVFVVRIKEQDGEESSFQNVIEAISLLRQRADVIFAEPAFPLPSEKL